MAEINCDKLKKTLDNHIGYDIKKQNIAGAVVFLAQCGKTVFSESYGYSDFEAKTPLSTDAIFRIASMSKPLVATAAMTLLDAGKISLEDKISRYLPEFTKCYIGQFNDHSLPISKVKAINDVRLINLLNHTSGFGSGAAENCAFSGEESDYETLQSVVSFYAENAPLAFEPGSQCLYSPVIGFDVIGRIIEKVADMSFYEYIKKAVFEPLEMYDTTYFLNEKQEKRLVKMFYSSMEGPRNIPMNNVSFGRKSERYSPVGAGVYSTAEEYSHFAQMLIDGGTWRGRRILSEKAHKLLTTDSQKVENVRPLEYSHFALGMTVDLKGHPHRAEGSYSWEGAFGTTWFADPKNEIVAIYLKNSYYFSLPFAQKSCDFEDDVYSSLK